MLPVLSCILFFSLVQTMRICIFRHNLRSFQLTFVVLCLLWTGLRVFFWINTRPLPFYAQLLLYRVPTVLEFATFSLLIILFTTQVRFPSGLPQKVQARDIGRLGSPCKAGGRCCSLTDACRCRRAPQFRAIGDLIGRAAPPHERSQPRTAHEPRGLDARKAHAERAHIV